MTNAPIADKTQRGQLARQALKASLSAAKAGFAEQLTKVHRESEIQALLTVNGDVEANRRHLTDYKDKFIQSSGEFLTLESATDESDFDTGHDSSLVAGTKHVTATRVAFESGQETAFKSPLFFVVGGERIDYISHAHAINDIRQVSARHSWERTERNKTEIADGWNLYCTGWEMRSVANRRDKAGNDITYRDYLSLQVGQDSGDPLGGKTDLTGPYGNLDLHVRGSATGLLEKGDLQLTTEAGNQTYYAQTGTIQTEAGNDAILQAGRTVVIEGPMVLVNTVRRPAPSKKLPHKQSHEGIQSVATNQTAESTAPASQPGYTDSADNPLAAMPRSGGAGRYPKTYRTSYGIDTETS